jgi:serine/threonine-protein phosphatase 5
MNPLIFVDPKEGLKGFRFNSARGGGEVFGSDVTAKFLDKNNLDLLVRSHEVRMQGFDVMHDGRCVTVFSAPNYCGSTGNLGAVMKFDSYRGSEVNDENKDHLLIKIIPFASKHYPQRPDDFQDQ